MKIRYTERGLVQRFGNAPVVVSDEMGARLLAEGKAIAITSFETPPIDQEARTVVKQKTSKLQWMVGGAGLAEVLT